MRNNSLIIRAVSMLVLCGSAVLMPHSVFAQSSGAASGRSMLAEGPSPSIQRVRQPVSQIRDFGRFERAITLYAMTGLAEPLSLAVPSGEWACVDPATVPVPPAGSVAVFCDSTNANRITRKNSDGGVQPVEPPGWEANTQSTDYTLQGADRGRTIRFLSCVSPTLTLPPIAGSFASGFAVMVTNGCTDQLKITATTQPIDGVGTISLSSGWMAMIHQDQKGTAWHSIRLPYSSDNYNGLSFSTPLPSPVGITSISAFGTTGTVSCGTISCQLPIGAQFFFTGTSIAACNSENVGVVGIGPFAVTATSPTTVDFSGIGAGVCNGATGGRFAQWGAAINLRNAAAPANSGVQFSVNSDGQVVGAIYNLGSFVGALDLDPNGQVGLFSNQLAAGMFVDVNGNTCLAGGGSCQNISFAPNGGLNKYKGMSTVAGNGLPVIVYSAGPVPATGNFPWYTMFTTPASGYGQNQLYRVSGYLVATAGVPGSLVQATVSYTDVSGPNTQNTGAGADFGVAGNKLPFSFIIQGAPSSAIRFYTTTLGNPQYSIFVVLEAL